uniref:Odorant receptor n=1 Tax=Ceracris kiangsu TaxID=227354 RepID=A0A6M6DIG4_CERKI|nr:odorant receptor 73 [Ceracris kiangsu]
MEGPGEEERRVLGPVGGLVGLASGQRRSLSARLAECGRVAAAALNILANASLVTTTAVQLCADTPKETERASVTAFIFSVSTINFVKAVSLLRHRWRLRQLAGRLVAIRGAFADHAGTRRSYARKAGRLAITWVVTAEMNVAFWCLDPLISELLGGAVQERQLPLPLWLPFNQSQPSNYALLFTLESTMLMSGVQIAIIVDALFVTLIINVTAEIHVLNSNIRSMRKAATYDGGLLSMAPASASVGTTENRSKIRSNSSSISEVTAEPLRNESSADDEMYGLLVKNIQHHQLIIICVSELEKAVSMGTFALLSINILNLCSHIFSLVVMLEGENSASAITKMFVAVPVFMLQNGLYCLTGQAIIDESDRLINSAFGCGWPDADERFKRSLRVLMARASQPLRIRVGKLISLSRATFQELLKGSYQLFNVVYQVHTN